MRIAMIGQKGIPASWGGVERHVEELSTGLVRRGHTVTAYARQWYTQNTHEGKIALKKHSYQGVHLVFAPSLPTKHLDTITHVLAATLHALFQNYDVIHYHGVGPSLVAWIPRLFLPRTKIIATFHSPDRLHGKWGTIAKLVLTWGEWASCHFAHETITVSQTLQLYAAQTYKVPTIYVPNGVALPQTTTKEKTASVLRSFGLRQERYFIIIARFVSHKGIHLAMDAWRRAERDYPSRMRGLRLVIVGDEQGDKTYAESLRRMAKKIPHVCLAGWQDAETTQILLSESIALIQPSQSEGLSIAMLEAFAHGKPIIASDLPEHRELVTDSRFRYEKTKITQLEERMVWLIANPEIAHVEGLRNREKVECHYNWDAIIRQTEHIYADAVLNREWNWQGIQLRAE
ncbi:MAG: Glycosyltransferase [Candidatus Magasanikbacteria bacterium GW2011_GWC2_45_8]|uniref:Glycosyltransferase n=1 Tax=Candidatus Magasanikbacteria bacterium GW2011_GWC2_45_8 TaxID=1619050 RepID=A0A0G1N0M3_9BACT|nr:MAG: Glycosyltransferase [Candidatus Magasanikbacteria bacterium GW2011_GWC2_45_8]